MVELIYGTCFLNSAPPWWQGWWGPPKRDSRGEFVRIVRARRFGVALRSQGFLVLDFAHDLHEIIGAKVSRSGSGSGTRGKDRNALVGVEGERKDRLVNQPLLS